MIDFSPTDLMQRAVDIVHNSPHPVNKIAATLYGRGEDGHPYVISCNNFWPPPIQNQIGTNTKIGNSSGTIHAETACLIQAPMTHDSALFVTDPPCPNCVKYMAEAGVSSLYIDHKGFDKDYAQRRGGDFENMSMNICRKAGIKVFKVFRKENRLQPILEIPSGYSPAIEKPVKLTEISDISSDAFHHLITQEATLRYKEAPFALTLARSQLGKNFMISAEAHPVIGYTSKTLAPAEGKYNYLLQPVNRLIMTARRYGFRIDPEYIFSSRVPTSRELVNMVGAGFTQLFVADMDNARDADGLAAKAILEKAQTMTFIPLKA